MEYKIGDVIEIKELTGQKCIVTKIMEGGAGIAYFLRTTSYFIPELVMKIIKDKIDIENAFREARLWSKIGHHKNIASYLCCGIINDKFYILSNRYEQTLDKIPKNNIDNELIKNLLLGIINGLDYAYKQVGLIHRDLKPQNIFVDSNLEPKIGDFGLSSYIKKRHYLSSDLKNIFSKLTISSQLGMGGTIPYMAPELFSNNPNYSISSDIFALGITIFNLITELNFPYNLPEYTNNPYSFELFNKSKISPSIKKIILKCINIDKNKRYQTYSELIKELECNLETIYEPSLRDYIDNIQTLRRTKQFAETRLKLNEALNKFNDHPSLINQLAILEKDEKGINASINIYEKLFTIHLKDNYEHYWECLFNLTSFYLETMQYNKIVPIINKYEYIFTNMDFIKNEYIEYSIYLGLKRDYENCYKYLYNYCRTHSLNDIHALFLLFISSKLNKTDECIKIIEKKQNEVLRGILNVYLMGNIDNFNIIINNIENDIFGGV